MFSGPMVQAILEGHKTQTRRVVKPQPQESYSQGYTNGEPDPAKRFSYGWSWQKDWWCSHVDVRSPNMLELCPYGKAGDPLWVRETWRLACVNAELLAARFWTVQFSDFAVLPHPQPAQKLFEPIAARDTFRTSQTGIEFGKWKPSIYMPRWASRITLEIVNVRVERVQDISTDDALHEGTQMAHVNGSPIGWVRSYKLLWNSINASRGYGWDVNPWVWVIEFKQVTHA
jgi:hypothetical protein